MPSAAMELKMGKWDDLCFLVVSEGFVHIFPVLIVFGYPVSDWFGLEAP